ncbi:hydrogenase maturation nickel metallochaperone HypA [Chloroflexota bacterium]
MHELAITNEMIKLVADEAGKAGMGKINKINLIVGKLTGYVNDSIQFYFDILSKDTVAEGAKLFFTTIPGQLQCNSCQKTFELDQFDYICPGCNGVSVKLVSGSELRVESIEGD